MRRLLIGILAVIGGLGLFGSAVGFVLRHYVDDDSSGTVLGRDGEPAVGAPVFLDRGDGVIERFVTDSQGRFNLPLEDSRISRAKWLICVPGGIPTVGYPDDGDFQVRHMTYAFTEQEAGKPAFIRAKGWLGPIPRECPPPLDSVGWRYPRRSGYNPDRFTLTEPDWNDHSR